jgi:hypothetical protein|nr:MAG TPA: hypothetical protein [Caudoviricetes sp.]
MWQMSLQVSCRLFLLRKGSEPHENSTYNQWAETIVCNAAIRSRRYYEEARIAGEQAKVNASIK